METCGIKCVEVQFVGDEDVDHFINSLNDTKTPGMKRPENYTPPKRSSRREKRPGNVNDKFTYTFAEDSIDEDEKTDWKPTALFEEGDVSGQHIFGFRTPKRRVSIILKAASATKQGTNDSPETQRQMPKQISTPKRDVATPKGNIETQEHKATPKRSKPPSNNCTPVSTVHRKSLISEAAVTPYGLRSQLKRRISSLVQNEGQSWSDGDFSASDSDFSPSDSGEEGELSASPSQDACASDSGGEVQEKAITAKRNHKQLNFVAATDAYFTNAASKMITSDRTLGRLATPQLSEDTLRLLLAQVKPAHESAVQKLNLGHRHLFRKWIFALSEGFSVMLYGVGSKLNLLKAFQRSQLQRQSVIVVNGFFPSLVLKEVVDAIANTVQGTGKQPSNIHECLDLIERRLGTDPTQQLFLLVHNLDGATLKTDRAQEVVSRLAAMPGIHLLASVDHINTQLLWDQSRLARLNPIWFDATSLLPYSAETSFETSLLVKQSGALALSSLSNVFRSLTANARGIFLVIAKHQLDHRSSSAYSGMLFRELYRTSREQLLVSSDLALRAQLTEFLDHHLVKSKRSIDGSEMLVIPVDNTILECFMEQQAE